MVAVEVTDQVVWEVMVQEVRDQASDFYSGSGSGTGHQSNR